MMLGKTLIFCGTLLIVGISHTNLHCMNLDYSYIQDVINRDEKKKNEKVQQEDSLEIVSLDKTCAVLCVENVVFPEFPLSLSVSKDINFNLSNQFSSVFPDNGKENPVISECRHGLYTCDAADDKVFRVLISIKYFKKIVSYRLNIDKYDSKKKQILNAVFIPMESINLNDSGEVLKIEFPIEEITKKLQEFFAELV